MKKILFSILAAAAIVCGCAREMEPEGSTLVPSSKYLVISADCSPITKTDIVEGKSTWEKGDKITVLYNGEAYEYVAGTPSEDGKQTYFTSTAGITDYDGTGLTAYYEAINGAEGTVGIAAERDIEFFDLAQKNPACAPLIGASTKMENGVLNMYFKNIFSVVELRIDPAGSQMTSPMKSMKIEPADGSAFEGYLTCTGLVDYKTLALETSKTGKVLTLNFPDQADARVAQVLKFPVGRFSSSKGLKVTLTLEDGSQLVKNIYKSGITTYAEQDGNFSVMHLAKAMYAFSGGIGCAQDLVDFAAAVNSGGSLIEYMNDEGKVVLLDDIDMTGVTNWTPIGNGTFTGVVSGTDHKSSYTGKAFKGHFDGQGHSIRNMKLTADLSGEGAVYGLFGIIDGAVIENVTLGAAENDNSEFAISADATTDAAVLAGVCYGSEIRNCVNYVPMHNNGNSTQNDGNTNTKRTTAAAFAGFVYSNASKASVLDNLVNYGSITVNKNKNTSNSANSVVGAGIAGIADALMDGAVGNTISNCVNYGDMTSDAPRTSGIITAANQHTLIEKCVNYGDQTNSNTGTRVGMITCVIGNDCALSDCENYGDAVMTASGTGAQAGGLLCLVNNAAAKVTGGGNYGMIITNATTRGLLIANISNASKVDGIVAGGSIGSYNGGEYSMVELTTSNYMSHIGVRADGMASKVTNIIFNGPDAKGIRTADELLEFAKLVNAGSSTAKFEQNGVVVLLNDIDMSGKSWTPIGKANAVVGNTYEPTFTGKPFTGKFNGGGYTIRNLKLVSSASTAGDNFGFFSTLGSGAVVENLNFDSSCSLEVTATASVASGVLAGYMYDATVRNVTSYAPMTFNGKAGEEKFMSMAMIGESFAQTAGSVIENCHNYGEIKAYNSDNTKNGGTGYHAAGIVGYTMAPSSATAVTTISGCTNHGNMTSGLARTSGIVAGAPRNAAISNCINYGDQFNNFYKTNNARLGGIVCIAASKATITGCINYGDITSSTSAIIGGIACQYQSGTATGCENYGIILTDHASRGLLQGYDANGKPAAWSNCVAGGLVGTYNNGIPSYDIYWNTNGNPTGYLGNATYNSTFTDITYKIDTLDPEEKEANASLNVLFIGNSFTQDAVTHLPGILAAAGIDNVKMTHMYYGGCTMSVYNAEWATKKNYICFECKPGGRTWSPSTGKTLKEITESRQWDIVTIQEHTGNNAAWVWNNTDKTDVNAVISYIKSSQSNAKLYFILSQAYHNMDKIASEIRGDVNWGVDYNTAHASKSAETILAEQIGMYEVIVDYGKGVMKDCAVDGLIATGTMLQNLRTTSLNNNLGLSRDGYHMDYGLARYGASCAVFETLFAPRFGVSMDTNSYRYARTGEGYTPVTDANAAKALQAARYALERPFEITNMSETPVGISSAADFYEFLSTVSAGKSLYKWTGTDGEVNLLADVNLSSITKAQWQALATKNLAVCQDNDCYMSGSAFHGVFDGNGKTISGFNPNVTLDRNGSFGLFCLLEGATVKNVNLSGTVTVSATEQAVAGMLAGTALNSTIRNVKVSGKIVSSGTTATAKRFALGGVCGFAFASTGATLFENCTTDAVAEVVNGSNDGIGGTGVMYGGIVGMASTFTDATEKVTLKTCTNNGNMSVSAGRASGIIATCFRNTILDGCVNNGNQTNAKADARLGNISSYIANGCKLFNCVNNGNLTATHASYGGTIAGVVALANSDSDATIEGGGNYGVLTAPSIHSNGKWKGLIVANFGGASMKNVVVSGKMFYAGSQIEINADNFTSYVCGNYDASKMTGLTFVAPNN